MVLLNGIGGIKSPVFFHINLMKYSSEGLVLKKYAKVLLLLAWKDGNSAKN